MGVKVGLTTGFPGKGSVVRGPIDGTSIRLRFEGRREPGKFSVGERDTEVETGGQREKEGEERRREREGGEVGVQTDGSGCVRSADGLEEVGRDTLCRRGRPEVCTTRKTTFGKQCGVRGRDLGRGRGRRRRNGSR